MEHFGVVLAGGQSSRMGVDKADLMWHQHTLLQHMLQRLRASLCQHVLISRNHHQGINDRFKHKGPLAGIDAVLQQLPEHCLLTVIPVDMPLLESAAIIHLQTYAANTRRSVYYSQSFLPCIIVVNNSLRTYIEQQLSSDGSYSIKGMLCFIEAEQLLHPEPNRLCNTNTPQQWDAVINTVTNNHTHAVR